MSALTAACSGIVAFLLWAGAARADSCAHPNLLETLPKEGARAVPPNAKLSARYAQSAEYGEAISLEHVGLGDETFSQSFDPSEGILSVEPHAPLLAGDAYIVRWPALRGISSASRGEGGHHLHFTAGSEADLNPPTFDGVRTLSWDVDRAADICTDAKDDRYVFELGLDDAKDDGGKDLLTVIVFQTAGPHTDQTGAPNPVLVSDSPKEAEGGNSGVPWIAASGACASRRWCAIRSAAFPVARTASSVQRPPSLRSSTVAAWRHAQGARRVAWVFAAAIVVMARRRRRSVVRARWPHAALALSICATSARGAYAEMPAERSPTATSASRLGYALRAEPARSELGPDPFTTSSSARASTTASPIS